MRKLLPLPSKQILPTKQIAKYLVELNDTLTNNKLTEQQIDKFEKLQLTYYGYASGKTIPINHLYALEQDIFTSINAHTLNLLENLDEPIFGVYKTLLERIEKYNKILTKVNEFITLPDLLPTVFKISNESVDEYVVLKQDGSYYFYSLDYYSFDIDTNYFDEDSTNPVFIKYLQKYRPESLL